MCVCFGIRHQQKPRKTDENESILPITTENISCALTKTVEILAASVSICIKEPECECVFGDVCNLITGQHKRSIEPLATHTHHRSFIIVLLIG